MSLPDAIYHIRRVTHRKKPYYGRSDRRIYAQKNHVTQYIGSNQHNDEFEIHKLTPGGQWEDVTKEWICEHHIGVCVVCGDEYDVDFEPALYCHDDDSWHVRIEHRIKCLTHGTQ